MTALGRPTVPEVMPLIRAYYAKPDHGAGGSLHIVLDDGNTDDDDIRWCREYAVEQGDADGIVLADLLVQMSRAQRNKICNHYDQYRTPVYMPSVAELLQHVKERTE